MATNIVHLVNQLLVLQAVRYDSSPKLIALGLFFVEKYRLNSSQSMHPLPSSSMLAKLDTAHGETAGAAGKGQHIIRGRACTVAGVGLIGAGLPISCSIVRVL